MENRNRRFGLKGSEVTSRIISLMGLKESFEPVTSTHGFELVKKGPDGYAYAIVRENQQYFLKKALLKEGLAYQDFDYLGGLQNKAKGNVYESFSKATQYLNLRLIDLRENFGGEVCDGADMYKNDMELEENSMVALGDDIETVTENDDVIADEPELTENDMAIDHMINGTFAETVIDEVEVGFEEDDYSIDGMSDKVMESYNRINKLLNTDLKKKA